MIAVRGRSRLKTGPTARSAALVALLAVAAACGVRGEPSPTTAPVGGAPAAEGALRFRQLEADMGSADPGSVLRCRFPFTVVGETPILLRRLQASCACTSVQVVLGQEAYTVDRERFHVFQRAGAPADAVPEDARGGLVLPAGRQGYIAVELRAGERPGSHGGSLHVDTDEPRSAPARLLLRWHVRQVFRVEPEHVVLEEPDWSVANTFSIRIEAADGRPFRIEEILDCPSGWKVAWEPAGPRRSPESAWRVTGTLPAPLCLDQQGGLLRLATEPGSRTVAVPVRIRHRETVTLDPGTFVNLGVAGPGAVVERTLRVRLADRDLGPEAGVKLQESNLPEGAITLAPRIEEDRRTLVVQVGVRMPEVKGVVRGRLRIQTSHPHRSSVDVVIVGRVGGT